MKMDHELKQRLIGAVVVTALCAIFIPMLFDDPVDNTGQNVSELSIPASVNTAVDNQLSNEDQLPKSTDVSSASGGEDELSSEMGNSVADEINDEPRSQQGTDDALYAESVGYAHEEAVSEDTIQSREEENLNRNKGQSATRPNESTQNKPISEPPDSLHKVLTQKQAASAESLKIRKLTDAPKSVGVKETGAAALSEVEPIKPLIKKAENDAPVLGKDAVSKANVVAGLAKEQEVHQINSKQSSSMAKELAVAVAEAKNPAASNNAKPVSKPVRWYIQLGSFTKKENAVSLWESLHDQGLAASLDTVQTDKGLSYRLRVGPESDGKKAAAMKSRLDKQNIKSILISE